MLILCELPLHALELPLIGTFTASFLFFISFYINKFTLVIKQAFTKFSIQFISCVLSFMVVVAVLFVLLATAVNQIY